MARTLQNVPRPCTTSGNISTTIFASALAVVRSKTNCFRMAKFRDKTTVFRKAKRWDASIELPLDWRRLQRKSVVWRRGSMTSRETNNILFVNHYCMPRVNEWKIWSPRGRGEGIRDILPGNSASADRRTMK